MSGWRLIGWRLAAAYPQDASMPGRHLSAEARVLGESNLRASTNLLCWVYLYEDYLVSIVTKLMALLHSTPGPRRLFKRVLLAFCGRLITATVLALASSSAVLARATATHTVSRCSTLHKVALLTSNHTRSSTFCLHSWRMWQKIGYHKAHLSYC